MTTPQARKSPRFLRWFFASRDSARSNIQLAAQIPREPSSFDPGSLFSSTQLRSLSARHQFAFAQPRHPRQSNPHRA
jgi:hypothetical protein